MYFYDNAAAGIYANPKPSPRDADVAVDIRKRSPTFWRHIAVELSAENKLMPWMHEGFAHDYVVLSENSAFL